MRVLIHVDVHESTQHVPYHLVCLISLTTGWILIGLMRATARTNPLSKQKSPTQVTPYFKQTLILTHSSDTEISAVESEHGLFPDSPPSLFFNSKPSFPTFTPFVTPSFHPLLPQTSLYMMKSVHFSRFLHSPVNINSIWVIFTGVGKMNAPL